MATENQRENAGFKAPPQPQTIEMYIIPVQVMDEVKRKLRKLTIDDGEVILQTLNAIRPQMVQQAPPGMMDPPEGQQ